jgi:hypothetical protein
MLDLVLAPHEVQCFVISARRVQELEAPLLAVTTQRRSVDPGTPSDPHVDVARASSA